MARYFLAGAVGGLGLFDSAGPMRPPASSAESPQMATAALHAPVLLSRPPHDAWPSPRPHDVGCSYVIPASDDMDSAGRGDQGGCTLCAPPPSPQLPGGACLDAVQRSGASVGGAALHTQWGTGPLAPLMRAALRPREAPYGSAADAERLFFLPWDFDSLLSTATIQIKQLLHAPVARFAAGAPVCVERNEPLSTRERVCRKLAHWGQRGASDHLHTPANLRMSLGHQSVLKRMRSSPQASALGEETQAYTFAAEESAHWRRTAEKLQQPYALESVVKKLLGSPALLLGTKGENFYLHPLQEPRQLISFEAIEHAPPTSGQGASIVLRGQMGWLYTGEQELWSIGAEQQRNACQGPLYLGLGFCLEGPAQDLGRPKKVRITDFWLLSRARLH